MGSDLGSLGGRQRGGRQQPGHGIGLGHAGGATDGLTQFIGRAAGIWQRSEVGMSVQVS
jgi:hypothetical protein